MLFSPHLTTRTTLIIIVKLVAGFVSHKKIWNNRSFLEIKLGKFKIEPRLLYIYLEAVYTKLKMKPLS